MSALFGRWLWLVTWMSIGAAVGGWLGESFFHRLELGAWIGAALGIAVGSARDVLRAYRVLRWLRDPSVGSAPRGGELWGELAYYIERALQSRDRMLAQEKRQLTQFLSAIEASPNGVLMLDADEQISWMNSASADHFGLDPQRDRGQRITNLVRSPGFVGHLQSGDYEEPVTVVNHGRDLTLMVLLRRYGDGLKLVISSDVTERLRAEGMRRDFVANVSHEIRTPLTVLSGFVETLVNLPLGDAERRHVFGLMTQQTQRMQLLVGDLLTLAQLEGSPRPPVDRWVDLGGLLAQVEVETRGLSNGRHVVEVRLGIAPQGDEDEQELFLAGNPTELMSAFTNLCSNAVRYTPEGGRIALAWKRRDNGDGVFEVRDSGIGIPREHIPRLTERFYRVDGSRSRESGGTGLGLSIVKHVMQRHGGAIEVDSEPGAGSSFRLVFPAARIRSTRTQATED
ncbi:phosphate regulon sensor histidine kinase PhoR [Sphaerotilus mobilis]|uniref:Phosphate regulon sensor protein PhoR n=1 Tax=Sphaerotilus mobilis TaxID=47994 RepID=A0A4Q7LUZ4_9BURK|nr:phosphate regulon sensor histidine kinase PhoR [Sphaerotilus mobilis]RZS58082.1 two-component system phosphate regulon sensor histidine kinase PhoR [Sphaerotilus mobilis]